MRRFPLHDTETAPASSRETLGNTINHFADTPLDGQLHSGRWDARPGSAGTAST